MLLLTFNLPIYFCFLNLFLVLLASNIFLSMIRLDLCEKFVTRLSNNNCHPFRRKMAGNSIESTVNCVTVGRSGWFEH